MNYIKNPIIPGFYPDPSICRVGDDYYICCSSFELCPGLPIFHSKDLANWEQIGFAVSKENKLHVQPNIFAGAVMAPTIRYHKGTFYVINCNFADKGNFMVTATDPAGPWSDPIYLDDIPGIDASIFFDEDEDKTYVMGTGEIIPTIDGGMRQGIWACEYDIDNFKCIGKPVPLWGGSMENAASPEAPHIYKIGDYYYLLIAEGGTEHYHAVTIARSKNALGPYEAYRANPVMTHRHLGFNYEIGNVGHADLVETPDGNWYAVMLASRTIAGYHKNLGRETFICPVTWERDWPVFSPGTGKLEYQYPADEHLPWTPVAPIKETEDFDSDKLDMHWTFWGTNYLDFYRMSDSRLYLRCLPRAVSEELKSFTEDVRSETNGISFIARRQQQKEFYAESKMIFDAKNKEAAGIIVMQASNHSFRLEKTEGKIKVIQTTSEFNSLPFLPDFESHTHEEVLLEKDYTDSEVTFVIDSHGQFYDTYYIDASGEKHELYMNFDSTIINPEKVGGMVGTLVGMYATANHEDSANEAAFEYFTYKE